MRALISVYDKEGLDEFARGLDELGFELVASGGTAAFLEEQGLAVTRVEDVTQAPEMLGGRVKTLHPRIHGGILARRDRADDVEALDEQDIEPFDLVCVNFYPFSSIGDRAAADAHGGRGRDDRHRRARRCCARPRRTSRTSRRSAIRRSTRPSSRSCASTGRSLPRLATRWPPTRLRARRRTRPRSRAGSPRARACPRRCRWRSKRCRTSPTARTRTSARAYYREIGARRHLLSQVEQLHGKALSFNNLYDLAGALMLLREFTRARVRDRQARERVRRRRRGDDRGGLRAGARIRPALGLRDGLRGEPSSQRRALAERIAEQFVDVLFAPDYEPDALDAWKAKPAARILADRERRAFPVEELDYKRVPGGLLVQDRDWDIEEREGMNVVAGAINEEEWGDLLFAWRVCKHIWSNAIVIAKDLQTIGIGAGQQSRVDAVRIALEKAQKFDHDLDGSVLASDAFFPFADGPEQALARGVAAIIQPGGSKRDAEVVAAVERAGAAMVFTGRRHFRH